MRTQESVSESEVTRTYYQLVKDTKAAGYYLNPDETFTRELVRGLCINKHRYSYQACPCRLASGNRQEDLDIICPCDYRDADLEEFGTCYCGLYVSEEISGKKKQITPIPERRPSKNAQEKQGPERSEKPPLQTQQGIVVWRCRVCGYLCARSQPPQRCPICKATKDRFEQFS
jgi:ferredoxin-thioredoxin reductase catalytic subunit